MLRRAFGAVGLPAGRALASSAGWAGGEASACSRHVNAAVVAFGDVAQRPRLFHAETDRGFGFAHLGLGVGPSRARLNGGCIVEGIGRTLPHTAGVIASGSPRFSLASFATAADANVSPGLPKPPLSDGFGRAGARRNNRGGGRGRQEQRFRVQEQALVHVSSMMNNTFVTLTSLTGDVIAWKSGGTMGFKGSRRSTAFVAQMVGEAIGKECVDRKLGVVAVKVKGPGYGKESALRGLKSGGVKVVRITDVSTTPHNGCRPKRKRRT